MPENRHQWLITVSASGYLLDPELGGAKVVGDQIRAVGEETRLELFGGDLVLHFEEDRFRLFAARHMVRFFFHPLHYFLVYQSRISYRIFWPEIDAKVPEIATAREVIFAQRRWLGGEPAPVTVTSSDIGDLVDRCTPELYMALVYYLLGCDNPRYFLVEFYKAFEVIENAFGGEAAAIDALRPLGVERTRFRELKRAANDYQRPFDIGRHAPRGADVRSVDLRRMLEEPMSRQLFTDSVIAVRQAIDAYFSWLRANR